MSRQTDVVVIGGGIIGCWTARHLAASGCSVTLLERNLIGSGASSGNCGYICPSHVHPLCGPGAIGGAIKTMAKFGGALSVSPRYDPALWSWLIRFARRCNTRDFEAASLARHALLASSRSQYQAFSKDRETVIDWQQRGLLMVYRSQKDFAAYKKSADRLRQDFGIRIDRLDGNALCELEPALVEGLAGGWHFPDDAHLSPTALLKCLSQELREQGVTICEHADVKTLRLDGNRLASLETSDGRSIAADRFVFTTGAEAPLLTRQLDMRVPVIPGKGFSVTIDQTLGTPSTPMIFEEDHVAVTPLSKSFRIGSTMQLTGYSRSIPDSRIELLKRSARQHLRQPLPTGRESRWSGWRPMMPDGLPCIDRSPKVNNAFVAAGNGMIGMATGPATGQLVSELILERPTHIAPSPYRLNRF